MFIIRVDGPSISASDEQFPSSSSMEFLFDNDKDESILEVGDDRGDCIVLDVF
jgi:hypothetical protein